MWCMTEHFDPDGDGGHAKLVIGAYDVIHFRRSVPDPFLALFRDSQWTRIQTDINMLDEPIYSYTLVSPAKEILARLALYGITDAAFQRALDECRTEREAGLRQWLPEQERWVTRMQRYYAMIDSIKALAPLLSARIEWNMEKMDTAQAGYPAAEDLLSALHRRDPRLIIYACTIVAPTATVVLDLTDLVSNDSTEEWWIRPDGGKLCAIAVTRLSSRAGMPPVRVLTEGSTDAEFIEAALKILRPDITDLITFLNPEAKPELHAAALARMVKQFSAARVTQPVVALFDNDMAGHKERDTVPISALPSNINVATMPDLALTRAYPTILPPPAPRGSIQIEDINGRACSIEMYLGVDVLTNKGILEPVQWSTSPAGHLLQGSLVNKKRVQARYRNKVKQARIDTSAVVKQDWEGMRAIIETILQSASTAR
jgi:hypothetical protein